MNIKINEMALNDLINKLESDNETIIDVLRITNDSIRSLNESVWESKEKKQLDYEIEPFLTSIDRNAFVYLNECTSNLRKALVLYQKNDQDLTGLISKN